MLYNPTLWNIYRRCDALPSKPHPMAIQIRDLQFFKMACHTVMRYHQVRKITSNSADMYHTKC